MDLPPRITRVYLRVLQLAGLIGLVLSVIGWAVISVQRIYLLASGTVRFPGTAPAIVDSLLFILEGMREAAVPLFLSAILLVVGEIALRLVPRTTPRDPA